MLYKAQQTFTSVFSSRKRGAPTTRLSESTDSKRQRVEGESTGSQPRIRATQKLCRPPLGRPPLGLMNEQRNRATLHNAQTKPLFDQSSRSSFLQQPVPLSMRRGVLPAVGSAFAPTPSALTRAITNASPGSELNAHVLSPSHSGRRTSHMPESRVAAANASPQQHRTPAWPAPSPSLSFPSPSPGPPSLERDSRERLSMQQRVHLTSVQPPRVAHARQTHNEKVDEIIRRQRIEESIQRLSAITLKAKEEQDKVGRELNERKEREQALGARLQALLAREPSDADEAKLACEAATRRIGAIAPLIEAMRERLRRFEAEAEGEVDEMKAAVRLLEEEQAEASAALHDAERACAKWQPPLQQAWQGGDEESFIRDYLSDFHEQVRRRLEAARGLAAELAQQRARFASVGEVLEAVAARLAEVAEESKSAALGPPGGRLVVFESLSAEAEERVASALRSGNPAERLADFRNIPVCRKDMATLLPRQWLNDEVINYFLKLLEARAETDLVDTSAGRLKIHFMNTQFYHKLAGWGDGGYLYKNVARWTKRVDIFSKDIVIVPIHCHGNHWTLALINFMQRRFEYLDSLFGGDGGVLANLRRYLEDEHLNKKQASYDTNGWQDLCHSEIPRQRNGFDCGVFMCTNANLIARGAALTFTQAELPYLRRRMVFEILQAELFDV
uniref:Ubiquitin-like protease family profile domain-containing protein n=1 Tax=Calcidiscus leptoporus TaxID=127549 RepID=A0A7S0IT36_9EUKA